MRRAQPPTSTMSAYPRRRRGQYQRNRPASPKRRDQLQRSRPLPARAAPARRRVKRLMDGPTPTKCACPGSRRGQHQRNEPVTAGTEIHSSDVDLPEAPPPTSIEIGPGPTSSEPTPTKRASPRSHRDPPQRHEPLRTPGTNINENGPELAGTEANPNEVSLSWLAQRPISTKWVRPLARFRWRGEPAREVPLATMPVAMATAGRPRTYRPEPGQRRTLSGLPRPQRGPLHPRPGLCCCQVRCLRTGQLGGGVVFGVPRAA